MSARLRVSRVVAALGVVTAVVSAGSGTAWALRHRSDGPAVRYATAAEMARRAGCARTYQATVAYAGVVSAGRCRLHGAWVELRVLPSLDAAYAWLDGAHGPSGAPSGYNVVGDGWVAHSLDRTAMVGVTHALTASP
jgi:hypothetical protein